MCWLFARVSDAKTTAPEAMELGETTNDPRYMSRTSSQTEDYFELSSNGSVETAQTTPEEL